MSCAIATGAQSEFPDASRRNAVADTARSGVERFPWHYLAGNSRPNKEGSSTPVAQILCRIPGHSGPPPFADNHLRLTGRAAQAYYRPMRRTRENSLRSLVNIGPATEKNLQSIGINTADEFMSRDPYEIFSQLRRQVDPSLCRCALASLVGARLGIRWHKITKDAAREYQKRYPNERWANRC
jgi:hypothetical protein